MPDFSSLRAIRSKLADPAQPIIGAAYSGADDMDAGLPDTHYYAPLGGRGRRDRPDTTRRAEVERAMEFLDTHPLANRYASILNEWVVPEEFKPVAKDIKVQSVVSKFYNDPRNDWEALLPEYQDVKSATGELFFPAFVNPVDGSVVLDYWDPADVAGTKNHPKYRRMLKSVCYVDPAQNGMPIDYPAIMPVVDPGPMFGRLRGRDPRNAPSNVMTDPLRGLAGCLAFRFNKRPNSARGRGDFVPSLDYWVTIDDFLAATAERAQLLARLSGDVTIEGSDPKDIDDARKRYAKEPAYATLPFHNQKEKWNIQVASNNAQDAAELERMLRTFGSANCGIPPHVFSGDFTEGNRAVATSTMDPAYLRAKAKQRQMARVVKVCCVFAVDSVFLVNPTALAGVSDWTVEIQTTPLLKKDPEQVAPALAQATDALVKAVAGGFIDVRSARIVFLRMVNQIGVEDITLETVEKALSANPQPAPVADNMRRLSEELAPAQRTGPGAHGRGPTPAEVADGGGRVA